MHLLVIRHAIAEAAAPGQADADRALTADGRKRLKQVVRGLRALELPIDRVITSPWLRARDTADAVADLCDQLPIATSLLAQSPTAELLALIAEHRGTTALVGHEPWLSELVAWLAFGEMRHGEALELKKAAAVWLTGSAVPGGMTLCALLPPRMLRVLGAK